MNRIPVSGPWITRKEVDYVADAVARAWYSDANLYHARFEHAFADHLGVPHALALPSCTSAIHLALAALGVGPGDEVVVPEITWIATAAPIAYVGAQPIFADVDPVTWCLSPDSLRRCLSPRTKAVIPVDLYGGIPDMEGILAIAREAGAAVIEDAAQAIGAEREGRKAGSLADIGVFSFHGSKTLTTGEGGMLVTRREDIFERCLFLRDHGRDPGGRLFWNTEVAFKYRMSALQAALGLAQLERVDELVGKKREIFGWYHEHLLGSPGLSLNAEPEGTRNAFWMTTVVWSPSFGIQKEALVEEMSSLGVDCRPFFYPLSMLPAFSNATDSLRARERNAVAYGLSPYAANLPSALCLTRDDTVRACEALKEILYAPAGPARRKQ